MATNTKVVNKRVRNLLGVMFSFMTVGAGYFYYLRGDIWDLISVPIFTVAALAHFWMAKNY